MSDAAQPSLVARGRGGGGRRAARAAVRMLSPVLSLVVVVAGFLVLAPPPGYVAPDVRVIAVQTAVVATAAIGVTLVIIAGGIDLSIGSAVALAGVAAAMALKAGWPLGAAGATAVVTGGVCGLYNGLLITMLRLPPFIATLGTLGFFRGVTKWLASNSPVRIPGGVGRLPAWVQPSPEPSWLLVAPAIWVVLALAIGMAFLLRSTVFGRRAVAIGSNEDAARRCGVQITRTKIMVYAVSGLCIGLAGFWQLARITEGDPSIAMGLELDVIAAVVIGGASLSGGQGSIVGTLAGAALMTFLRERSVILGWPTFVQEMIVGHIIIVAVGIDQWRVRRGLR